MKRLLGFGAGLGVALASLVPLASAKDDGVDPAAREWSQARGNSTRSSWSACAPLAGEPVEAWKAALPGPLLAEPVTWGGTVFVAATDGKGRSLLAFRATTGEALGKKDLGSGSRVALATWQGTVIVGEPNQIRAFPHQGTKFGSGWSARGQFGGPPCIYHGVLFTCDGGDVICLDAARGTKKAEKVPVASSSDLGTFDETKAMKDGAPVGGAVGVYWSKADSVTYVVNVATWDNVALLSRTRVDDLTGPKPPQMRYTRTEVIGKFAGTIPDSDRWDMVPCRVDGEGEKASGAWIVVAPRPFAGGGTGRFVPDTAKSSGLNLVTAPAVVDSVAFSFAQSGDLQSWRANGRTETIVSGSTAPPGAKPGPATSAGGVVFLGNWAVEAGSNRIIWCVKQEATTPAIPAGDKRLVFGTGKELVCLADSSIAVASRGGAETAGDGAGGGGSPESGVSAVPPKMPADIPNGVLLADGRQIEGELERKTIGKYVFHPKDASGDMQLTRFDVVLAEKGGEVDLRGDDEPAFRIWRDAARGVYCDSVEPICQEYAKSRLLEDARRLIQRMRESGACEDRLQKLDSALNGKTQGSDAAKQKRLKTDEATAQTAMVEALSRGADWCAKRDLSTAATALLNEMERRKGAGPDPAIEARAKELVPEGFPWKAEAGAARRWMVWADALLPSSARFLDTKDDGWERLTAEPWKSGKPLGLRSRNVLMFLMDSDMQLCGRAMQLAEGTVRAVQVLLNEGDREDVANDKDRLEVRIHKDRKTFLAEMNNKEMEWAAGYYSPGEDISRFYVDRIGGGTDGPRDLAELGRVLTHELTHHYMGMRWMLGLSGGGHGHWVIEGMATFVENQAVQMERRGLAFNDETVPNLDAMSAVARQKALFPAEVFVDCTRGFFAGLSNSIEMTIKLRNSAGEKNYTTRGKWYDQAGALCFFFLFKRGAEGRAAFVQYVRLHYMGRSGDKGWASLGFETPEELQTAFSSWLSSLRGGG